MSVVVERGSARCPHCVAVADYAFIESERNVVRYEVHCRSCGQDYSEVNTIAPPTAPTERVLPLLPSTGEVPQRASWRRHLSEFGRAARQLRARVRPSGSAGLVAAEDGDGG